MNCVRDLFEQDLDANLGFTSMGNLQQGKTCFEWVGDAWKHVRKQNDHTMAFYIYIYVNVEGNGSY